MTGEDLGSKPGVVEKPKFEFSPLGKVFNKGLYESDKKEELLKRLKYIKVKNKEQLKKVEDQGERQLKMLHKKINKEVSFENIPRLINWILKQLKSLMTLRNKIKRFIIQNLSAMTQVSSITIILPSF